MMQHKEEIMTELISKSHLDKYDFDIRRTVNAGWLDQKCTIDVVCFVADCILNFIERDLVLT